MPSPETDAVDIVAGWVEDYAETWEMQVFRVIGDYPEDGDYVMIDIADESGLSGDLAAAQTYESTLDVEIGFIFNVEGESRAERVALARDKFAAMRRYLLDRGGDGTIQAFRSRPPVILSETDERGGQFAAKIDFTLYSLP